VSSSEAAAALVPLGQRHLEPVLHVHGERHLGRDGVALDDADAVAAEDGRGGELHLVVGEVLAEAEARPAVEGGKLVGGRGAWFILQAKVEERESGNFCDKAGCLLADSLSPNSDLFSLT